MRPFFPPSPDSGFLAHADRLELSISRIGPHVDLEFKLSGSISTPEDMEDTDDAMRLLFLGQQPESPDPMQAAGKMLAAFANGKGGAR